MKKIQCLISSFLLLGVVSCSTFYTSVYHKDRLISQKNAGYLGGKRLLLSGYYFSESIDEEQGLDTILPIILYPDGHLQAFGHFSGFRDGMNFDFEQQCGLKNENSYKSAQQHFECFLQHYDSKGFSKKECFDIWGEGVYSIKDDRITLQYYSDIMTDYYLIELKGKIQDNTHFVLSKKQRYRTGKEHYTKYSGEEKLLEEPLLFNFKKLDNLPECKNKLKLK